MSDRTDATAEALLLEGGRLIDGRGGEPIAEGALLIRDGEIDFAGAASDLPELDDGVSGRPSGCARRWRRA